eukprot:GHVQ01031400.1.p1 GENE.GHVQ01031400.1~~GHVQ01031400.1.p1  ORF type:complete len:221 (+),score=74.62 GHVQ01031400.1:100-762(+)
MDGVVCISCTAVCGDMECQSEYQRDVRGEREEDTEGEEGKQNKKEGTGVVADMTSNRCEGNEQQPTREIITGHNKTEQQQQQQQQRQNQQKLPQQQQQQQQQHEQQQDDEYGRPLLVPFPYSITHIESFGTSSPLLLTISTTHGPADTKPNTDDHRHGMTGEGDGRLTHTGSSGERGGGKGRNGGRGGMSSRGVMTLWGYVTRDMLCEHNVLEGYVFQGT